MKKSIGVIALVLLHASIYADLPSTGGTAPAPTTKATPASPGDAPRTVRTETLGQRWERQQKEREAKATAAGALDREAQRAALAASLSGADVRGKASRIQQWVNNLLLDSSLAKHAAKLRMQAGEGGEQAKYAAAMAGLAEMANKNAVSTLNRFAHVQAPDVMGEITAPATQMRDALAQLSSKRIATPALVHDQARIAKRASRETAQAVLAALPADFGFHDARALEERWYKEQKRRAKALLNKYVDKFVALGAPRAIGVDLALRLMQEERRAGFRQEIMPTSLKGMHEAYQALFADLPREVQLDLLREKLRMVKA
ncbi:MAG: hypothetical protein PVJ92_01210, partial [Candidatus Dependentiae bacterium]